MVLAAWHHWGLTLACWIAALSTSALALLDQEKSGTVAELLANSHGDIDDAHRKTVLSHLIHIAKTKRLIRRPVAPLPALPPRVPECPPGGAGVGNWATRIEEHHHVRHEYWAEGADFCSTLGLWTNGCGIMCPLRAAVIGTAVDLHPGQLVLDVGSGCGHFALWFHEWFGAGTLGVDFVEAAVEHARRHVATAVPSRFCWLNIATELGWLPSRTVDLVTAVSVIHYLRTDTARYEFGEEPIPGEGKSNATRTPCAGLWRTEKTQCSVARELFRVVRRGGHVWIAHNGSYKGKWDPRRVWGRGYWRCCFARELERGEAELREVPELEVFLDSEAWDPAYSVVLRREL